jgi:hypothetical protein
MVLDSFIHARRQSRKRRNRICSDGARGAGSLRGAHTENDAQLTVSSAATKPINGMTIYRELRGYFHPRKSLGTGLAKTNVRSWYGCTRKGGKRHEMPAHHNLEAYLDANREGGKSWMFSTEKARQKLARAYPDPAKES